MDNDLINELHNKLDAQDKIINTQVLEIARLKQLKYKFIDNCGEEESFTLEDYLDISNKLYDAEEEIARLKEIIYKARKMIFDNYGVLDKYEIELLDDVLKGDKENE